ncbi:C-type mannose receptor 2, partial [Anabas testudineus]|uniref:C-type mannose receptor 2 n=1 Tax=Anabas testudineus TaxID=64144 RepID=UPI000E455EDF
MDRRQRIPLQLLGLAALLVCVQCQCQSGWREYENKCYFFSTDNKSWMEANAFCLGQNSNLMSIQDIHERLWVRTQINKEIYWIGLNDQFVEGIWEWSDGSPFIEYLSYWMQGQPDNWGDEPGEDCGQVVGSSLGQWNDENCNVKRKYICKHVNSNPGPQCDLSNGWMQYASDCYKLKSDTKKSWTAARHDCVQDGGDLVSITTAEEEQYVIAAQDASTLDLWIGLSTLKCNKISCEVEVGNSQFTWADALQVGYTNWATGQPTVDTQTGSCAALIRDETEEFGKWRSHPCRYERSYMCKRRLNTICPLGWLSFSGSCYWMVSNKYLLTTWHEAHMRCSDHGAHLVIINSQEEQFFINGNLPDFHHVDIPDIWIGLSDKDKDGVFKWVDKTPVTFSNYGSGWPKNTIDVWDCGQIFTGNYEGKWETTNCFKSLGF